MLPITNHLSALITAGALAWPLPGHGSARLVHDRAVRERADVKVGGVAARDGDAVRLLLLDQLAQDEHLALQLGTLHALQVLHKHLPQPRIACRGWPCLRGLPASRISDALSLFELGFTHIPVLQLEASKARLTEPPHKHPAARLQPQK